MESTILRFATRFAEAGFYVFPLYGSNKGPMKPWGWARNKPGTDVPQDKIIPASNDVSFIAEWPERLTKGYNAPLVGYGVMGVKCVIFDLDNKDGKDGTAEFRKLQDKHGIPRPEFVVKSKSGGYHLYYSRPSALTSLSIKTVAGLSIGGTKYPGVDVRGDGGMVIGPLLECPENDWEPGQYAIIKGGPHTPLAELGQNLLISMSKSGMAEDPAMAVLVQEPSMDEMELLKRGEIPPQLSLGNRNNGFYLFLNALRNKGFSSSTGKKYALALIEVTEEKETLSDSVNIDEMIERIWKVDLNNPYDVVRDLIDQGLFRLTSYKSKLNYIILPDNPYLDSKSAHDIGSMKQLLAKFTRTITLQNGKSKVVNPADLIDGFIGSDREVSTIGFKPGSSDVFTLTAAEGGRRFLNSWRDPRNTISRRQSVDETIWEEFKFIVSRIFGPEGSDEFQLGLDFPAWILQRPGVKPVVAPFIMSQKRGVGKSVYFSTLMHMFGYSKMGDLQARAFKVSEITGRFFNPTGASLLLFDEVQFPVHRNMRQESSDFWKHLKSLVTQDTIPVEIKGGDTYQMPNFTGVMMAGNTGNNFPVEEFDRRIWLIDNDPPELDEGLIDRFFLMGKGELSHHEKQAIINSLLMRLSEHKIKLQLDRMRAPMNIVKREMYLATLSDIEEWWITYFEDRDNLLSAAPILTKSAVLYLISIAERLINSRWREDPEGTFRELKRRGLLQPVRIKGNNYQTRNIRNVPLVKTDGTIMQDGEGRDVLYTTRQHGEFNDQSNEVVMQMFFHNINGIVKWKKELQVSRSKHIGGSLS